MSRSPPFGGRALTVGFGGGEDTLGRPLQARWPRREPRFCHGGSPTAAELSGHLKETLSDAPDDPRPHPRPKSPVTGQPGGRSASRSSDGSPSDVATLASSCASSSSVPASTFKPVPWPSSVTSNQRCAGVPPPMVVPLDAMVAGIPAVASASCTRGVNSSSLKSLPKCPNAVSTTSSSAQGNSVSGRTRTPADRKVEAARSASAAPIRREIVRVPRGLHLASSSRVRTAARAPRSFWSRVAAGRVQPDGLTRRPRSAPVSSRNPRNASMSGAESGRLRNLHSTTSVVSSRTERSRPRTSGRRAQLRFARPRR